jgi:hypothetical protein
MPQAARRPTSLDPDSRKRPVALSITHKSPYPASGFPSTQTSMSVPPIPSARPLNERPGKRKGRARAGRGCLPGPAAERPAGEAAQRLGAADRRHGPDGLPGLGRDQGRLPIL